RAALGWHPSPRAGGATRPTRPTRPVSPGVAASRGAVVSVQRAPCRFGCCWIIERLDRLDIVFSVPPLPVAILPRVDQPALFESFQGGGANPHLVGCLGNTHTSSPEASLSRPFRVIRDHSRPWAAR